MNRKADPTSNAPARRGVFFCRELLYRAAAKDCRDDALAASMARTRSLGRNGFCRHTTSEYSGAEATKSSVVMPDIATIGRSGMRSRIILMRSKPLVPCRKISTIARSKLGIFKRLQSGRGAVGLDDLEMMHPQHDADHRANVGLVVDNKNAGHDTRPGFTRDQRLQVSLYRTSVDGRSAPDIIRSVGKEAVTCLSSTQAPCNLGLSSFRGLLKRRGDRRRSSGQDGIRPRLIGSD